MSKVSKQEENKVEIISSTNHEDFSKLLNSFLHAVGNRFVSISYSVANNPGSFNAFAGGNLGGYSIYSALVLYKKARGIDERFYITVDGEYKLDTFSPEREE